MIRSIINATVPIKNNGSLIIRTMSSKSSKLKPTESTAKIETNKREHEHEEQQQQQQQQQQQPWQPTKRVSRVTMEKIRTLAAKYPDHYNSVSLATEFRISPEAVKRILKSKFRPESLIADRQEKNRYAAMGVRKQQIQSKTITFPQTPLSSSFDMTSSTTRNSFGEHHLSSSSSTSTARRQFGKQHPLSSSSSSSSSSSTGRRQFGKQYPSSSSSSSSSTTSKPFGKQHPSSSSTTRRTTSAWKKD